MQTGRMQPILILDCELGVIDLIIVCSLEFDNTEDRMWRDIQMLKCGCPPQDDMNSFPESIDWAN